MLRVMVFQQAHSITTFQLMETAMEFRILLLMGRMALLHQLGMRLQAAIHVKPAMETHRVTAMFGTAVFMRIKAQLTRITSVNSVILMRPVRMVKGLLSQIILFMLMAQWM